MSFGLKSKVQKIIAVVLLFAIIVSMIGIGDTTAYAYEKKTGMVHLSSTSSLLQTYESASTDSGEVSKLVYGKPVTVIDETVDASGVKWYQITYFIKDGAVEKTAYCQASYILLDEDTYVTATGKTNANNVSLWSCTGTYQKPELAVLSLGTKVEIVDEITDEGYSWYRVRCTVDSVVRYGWILKGYVTKDSIPDIETDEEYEDYLRRIGFPESYIKPLAVLHEQYPNWKFEPFISGLKWEDVLAAQCKPGVSQTHMNYDDAYKSYASTEYNWYTNEWVLRDTTGWVTAHPDYVAYHLDPRNWFNDVNIFMFESLSYSDIHTLEGVQAVIKGTHMENDIDNGSGDGTMLNYSTAFMEIAKKVGASAYHLASRVRMEQGVYGTSDMISGKYPGYEGYYNYFNVKTYGVGDLYITRGLGFAKEQGWDTRYKSLEGGAAYLAKNYIAIGQDTLYLEKFDLIPQGGLYNHQYMTAIHAPRSESQAVAKAYPDKTQAFVFKIPVFEEMPEEPAAFTASGNRNNYLKTLDVEGFSLTPTFDGAKTDYSLIVDNDVTSIKISATPVVDKSSIEGEGTLKLIEGTNTFSIICKSESGDKKTYTLTVIREEKDAEETPGTPPEDTPEETPQPTYSSDKYTLGTYITGVAPQTTAADFVAGFTAEGCTLKVLTAEGAEHTGTVATGNKLGVYVDGKLVESKDIVIYGDVNGDGKINVLDAIIINRYTISLSNISGTYLVSADVNRDGKVNVLDAIIINRYTIGLSEIAQK